MRISVKVKANAKQEKLAAAEGGGYTAYVKAPAIENRANTALIELLCEHFNVPKSLIRIVSGKASKHKIIEIGNKNHG
ncbi:MAG: DUF167 domain-containing protein [Candidatus Omnitrophica bacterium]|nr:DUF167 domain-containing protein [Candidatus Omnitrophota bacterium]